MIIKLLFLAHNLLLSPKHVQRVGDDHGDDIMLKRRYNTKERTVTGELKWVFEWIQVEFGTATKEKWGDFKRYRFMVWFILRALNSPITC